jgi:hypothetical protein
MCGDLIGKILSSHFDTLSYGYQSLDAKSNKLFGVFICEDSEVTEVFVVFVVFVVGFPTGGPAVVKLNLQ